MSAVLRDFGWHCRGDFLGGAGVPFLVSDYARGRRVMSSTVWTATKNVIDQSRLTRRAVNCLARAIEPMEKRRLLSTVQTPLPIPVLPPLHPEPVALYDGNITPTNYRASYGLSTITFNGTPGDGTGETIAIVDAYDCPTLIDTGASGYSTSDLAEFDSLFGLPTPPMFLKVNEVGGSTLPTGTGRTAQSDSLETELDVEYAHAMAPNASIILVEANTPSQLWPLSMNTARSIPNVDAISLSWGGNETSGESTGDTAFQTPAGHNGITFTVASGDDGFNEFGWPAANPYVVDTGGTNLFETAGSYGYETAWSGSSGGVSLYETKPTYQSGIDNSASTTHRLIPDVSMDADTPVEIYDNDGYGGLTGVIGTSIVAPAFAGVMAVIDQGRALEGLGSLDGFTQTLPRIYALPSADFHDITTGSSGSNSLAKAGVGYDLVTGIGTPVGGSFVPDLAGGATISGTVYSDNNANGNLDGGEGGISGVTVYVDVGNVGSYVAGDPMAVTGANGTYSIQDDVAGQQTLVIREVAPAGYIQTGTVNPSFTTSYDAQQTENFGNFPTTYAGAQHYYVDLNGAGNTVQVYVGDDSSGTLTYSVATSVLGSTPLNFQPTAGADQLTIDYTNGNPMAASGQFTYTPATSSGSSLIVEGTPASSTISVTNAGVVVNSQTITTSGVQNVTIDAAGGSSGLTLNFTSNPYTNVTLNGQGSGDTITLTGTNTGTTTGAYSFGGSNESLNVSVDNPYTITGDAAMGATGGVALTDSSPLTLVGSQTLSSFAINTSNGSVAIARSSPSVQSVVVSTSLFVDSADGAYLDLDNNAMVINYTGGSPIGYVTGLLQTGSDGGAWDGVGIRSTAAANDPIGLTAIGAIDNVQLAAFEGSGYTSFAGVPVNANSVLLKYTYYGDADLSGTVDSQDVNLLDQGYGTSGGGWLSGDFDYSGTVDSQDVNLLDEGYGQTPAL
jgi:hypothetical protein